MPNFNWQQIPETKCIGWTGKRVTGRALTNSGQVEFIRKLAHPQPGVWELVEKFNGHGEYKKSGFFILLLAWICNAMKASINLHCSRKAVPSCLCTYLTRGSVLGRETLDERQSKLRGGKIIVDVNQTLGFHTNTATNNPSEDWLYIGKGDWKTRESRSTGSSNSSTRSL